MVQIIIFLLSISVYGPLFAIESLTLAEGDQWLDLKHRGTIWIEDGEIIQAQQLAGGIEFRALKSGRSEARIGKTEIHISVLSRAQYRTWQILKIATASTLGLSANSNQDEIEVTGKLVRFEDWETLGKYCFQKNCNYKMSAAISEDLQVQAQHLFAAKFEKISAYPYQIEFSDSVTLHLPQKFPQLEKIKNLTQRYGVEIVYDSSSLELQPLVRVQITVAEVKRSEALKYGVEWPEAYRAQILPNNPNGPDPFVLSLQTMEKRGVGRILASPNILCKSGKDAEFLAGGEFPIKVINHKMQDIIWKKYGIVLKVQPKADFSGRMSISLETEISSIDGDRTVDGIPGMYTNRLQSHFDLTNPQTIALSGLLKHESSEAQGGIPGLSRIPILGRLFSSSDFRDNKTELVIFVRPEIVRPGKEN